MAVPDYLWEIARQLADSTGRGKAEWQPTDRADAYAHITSKGSVEIASRDQDGTAPFILMILDPAGREVESYTTQLHDADDHDFLQLTRELFNLARRRALGTDKVVQDLLTELRRGQSD